MRTWTTKSCNARCPLRCSLRIEAEVKSILDQYVAEKDAFGAQTLCRRFHELSMWHPLLTNAELLAETTAVAQVARKLDGYRVSSLHETISELQGGAPIADAMLADWLRAFNAVERTEFRHDSIFDRPLHPDIKTAFIATERRVQQRLDIEVEIRQLGLAHVPPPLQIKVELRSENVGSSGTLGAEADPLFIRRI